MKLIDAHTVQKIGEDTLSQLEKKDFSIDRVFLTHLHADHTSALSDFSSATQVVYGKRESTFMQKALMGDHLNGKDINTLDFS